MVASAYTFTAQASKHRFNVNYQHTVKVEADRRQEELGLCR